MGSTGDVKWLEQQITPPHIDLVLIYIVGALEGCLILKQTSLWLMESSETEIRVPFWSEYLIKLWMIWVNSELGNPLQHCSTMRGTWTWIIVEQWSCLKFLTDSYQICGQKIGPFHKDYFISYSVLLIALWYNIYYCLLLGIPSSKVMFSLIKSVQRPMLGT